MSYSAELSSLCSTAKGLAEIQGISPIQYLQTFPNPCTIPPACFYNTQGLATFLNQNPRFKIPFSFVKAFRFLYPPEYTELFSSFAIPGYDPVNVPLCTNVQTLSYNQSHKYNQQLQLFQRIYSTNSNAYINYLTTGEGPLYYTFASNQERSDMKSAVALVNKLYLFDAMAEALGWQVPFPLT